MEGHQFDKLKQPQDMEVDVTSTESQKLLYDAPLLSPAQDRLGRTQFAKFLAKAISQMDAEEGFVFALNGPWGSGKTTIINFVLHFLEEEQKEDIVIVRFNPWWFSGREQLLQQFFRQFRVTLRRPDVPAGLKKIGEHLERLASILEPLALIPVIGKWTVGIKTLGRATKTVVNSFARDVYEVRASIAPKAESAHSCGDR